MYPLVSKLYSIAVIQPLSTAEVERIFSQVALIKTSQRANIKTVYKSSVFVFKKGMYTLRCMIPIVVSPFS
jgi:hypothetical protein